MQKLVLLIRIDHFEQMKAMIGPKRADAVRRQVFNVVRAACRTSDTVLPCRADECGAIAWVSDPDDGPLLADRIQQLVRRHVFLAGGGLEFGLTCSIGFSAQPSPGDESDRVLWRQTVKLARTAVDAASSWSDDAWFGYLGSTGPPPSAAGSDDDDEREEPPRGSTAKARTRSDNGSTVATDHRGRPGAPRSKTTR
jgi:GGDEF domain-containing protein